MKPSSHASHGSQVSPEHSTDRLDGAVKHPHDHVLLSDGCQWLDSCAQEGVAENDTRMQQWMINHHLLCPIFQYKVPRTKPRMTVTSALM